MAYKYIYINLKNMELSLFERDPQRGIVLIVAGLSIMLGGSLHKVFAKYIKDSSPPPIPLKKKFKRFTV